MKARRAAMIAWPLLAALLAGPVHEAAEVHAVADGQRVHVGAAPDHEHDGLSLCQGAADEVAAPCALGAPRPVPVEASRSVAPRPFAVTCTERRSPPRPPLPRSPLVVAPKASPPAV